MLYIATVQRSLLWYLCTLDSSGIRRYSRHTILSHDQLEELSGDNLVGTGAACIDEYVYVWQQRLSYCVLRYVHPCHLVLRSSRAARSRSRPAGLSCCAKPTVGHHKIICVELECSLERLEMLRVSPIEKCHTASCSDTYLIGMIS